ncbi:Cys/Met metabolism PLP-dependent enzyme-domain-containing protein [Mycena filopes]|nr:Cys/Met metabolism PLP-dependent enzyme-domain-containing protein [Mycena filopes]
MAASNFYRVPDFETLQLHAGQDVDPATKARAVPIYQSTSFVLDSVDHAAKICSLQALGNLYSRVANPTVDVFEKRMAALEGGMAAVATASGQAATVLTMCSLAAAGDNIVSSSRLYGGVYTQFKVTFKRFNIDCRFVTGTSPADYAAAIDEKTKAIYVESIANSDTVLADIAGIAKVAHDHGIPLVVDNTLGMGGYIVQPITLGADIVVHSATKWISGHGTIIAGVIVDSGKFNWSQSNKFPMITGPSAAYGGIKFAEIGGPVAFALQVRLEGMRDIGPCMSANTAFLALQGVETLSLRAERHCANALALAKFLDAHPKVLGVTYLGLPSHQSHQLAVKTLRPNSFGGMLTFRVEGGFEKAKDVIENLKLASHLSNLGDAKTLVSLPFVTIQAQLTPEERVESGVYDDMIRFSVGIESAADIIADVEGALKVVYG